MRENVTSRSLSVPRRQKDRLKKVREQIFIQMREEKMNEAIVNFRYRLSGGPQ